jgi:hypothetical protein
MGDILPLVTSVPLAYEAQRSFLAQRTALGGTFFEPTVLKVKPW